MSNDANGSGADTFPSRAELALRYGKKYQETVRDLLAHYNLPNNQKPSDWFARQCGALFYLIKCFVAFRDLRAFTDPDELGFSDLHESNVEDAHQALFGLRYGIANHVSPALQAVMSNELDEVRKAIFDVLQVFHWDDAAKHARGLLSEYVRNRQAYIRDPAPEQTAPADGDSKPGGAGPARTLIPNSDTGQPKVDGPFGPRGFRWGGVEKEFPKAEKRLYRFCVAAWTSFRSQAPCHINDLNAAYENAGGAALGVDSAENYARQMMGQLLAWFPSFPAEYKRDGDYYFRWSNRVIS